METKFKYLLLGLLSIGSIGTTFTSCTQNITELEPQNGVTFYNAFKTESDIEKALYAMERTFRDQYTSVVTRPSILGEVTDKVNSPGIAKEISWDPGTWRPGTSETNWQRFYLIIGTANLILDNLDRIENLPKERHDYYEGQALFMRSFLYFHMVRVWRDVPIILTVDDVLQHAKSPMKEVLDLAEKDAEKAVILLPAWSQLKDSNGARISTKQIVGKGAVWALLSHVYAWRAEVGKEPVYLDKAIDAANKVINSGEFTLAANPEEVIVTVRGKGNSSEGIFEGDVNFTSSGEIRNRQANITSESLYQGWPYNTLASKSKYKNNTYGIKNTRVATMFKPEDLRRDAYFYQFDALKDDAVLDGWAVVQTRREALYAAADSPTGEAFLNWRGNAILFSLADIILLRAECLALKGQDALAIVDINTIRTRAEAPLYDVSEGTVFTMVFREREKEFLFQRMRWFDCIRTGFWKTELSPIIKNLTPTDVDNGGLYLPVSTTAFSNNPKMTQNIYWLSRY
jgi:hypothetical protein